MQRNKTSHLLNNAVPLWLLLESKKLQFNYLYLYIWKKNLKDNYGWCKVELNLHFQINRKISKWNLHISWKELKRKRNNESWIQIQRTIQNLDLLKCLQPCVTENLDSNFHNSKSCHFRQSKCWIFNLLKIPHL